MRRWRAEVLVGVALAAATLVSFAPALENGFATIRGDYVAERVQAGLTAFRLTCPYSAPASARGGRCNSRPDAGGLAGFHLTTFAAHRKCCLIVPVLGR